MFHYILITALTLLAGDQDRMISVLHKIVYNRYFQGKCWKNWSNHYEHRETKTTCLWYILKPPIHRMCTHRTFGLFSFKWLQYIIKISTYLSHTNYTHNSMVSQEAIGNLTEIRKRNWSCFFYYQLHQTTLWSVYTHILCLCSHT